MILWVKSVPQHHLSSHTGHYNRTEVARSEVGGEVLLFAERWAGAPSTNPGFHHTPLRVPRDGTAGREQHLSRGTCSPWDALRWEGGCSSQEAPARIPAEGELCQGQGGGTSQHLSWELTWLAAPSHTPHTSSVLPLGDGGKCTHVPRFWGKSSVTISQVRIFQIM